MYYLTFLYLSFHIYKIEIALSRGKSLLMQLNDIFHYYYYIIVIIIIVTVYYHYYYCYYFLNLLAAVSIVTYHTEFSTLLRYTIRIY